MNQFPQPRSKRQSPWELEVIANDPNVDLILVSVKLGTHYALTKLALLAGKDVFVE
jgi:predicted dehydrogenase